MYKDKEVSIILAQSINGVIGINNKLPWYCPKDMEIFKAMTMGCCVIMGRNTWDSLPTHVKPLKGRKNIVVSRNKDLTIAGVTVANTLEQALEIAPEPIMVIGGGQLYQEAMKYADTAYMSRMRIIIQAAEGDAITRAPELDFSEFAMKTFLHYPEEQVFVKALGKEITSPAFDYIEYRRD